MCPNVHGRVKYIKRLSITSVREQTGVLGGTAMLWTLLGFSVEIGAALGGIGGQGYQEQPQTVPLVQCH